MYLILFPGVLRATALVGEYDPQIFWPLLKGDFLVVFHIWHGTSSSLEYNNIILVFY